MRSADDMRTAIPARTLTYLMKLTRAKLTALPA
jgi:hypothetical protein